MPYSEDDDSFELHLLYRFGLIICDVFNTLSTPRLVRGISVWLTNIVKVTKASTTETLVREVSNTTYSEQ